MEISLNELKINGFKHGFKFTESKSPNKEDAIIIEATKYDPYDNLSFSTYTEIGVMNYLNSAERVQVYIKCIRTTEESIKARERQSIGECDHNMVTHYHNQVCTKCRGKFAQNINIQLGCN